MNEQSRRPPQWAVSFLRWFCPTDLGEGIEGDLMEQFEADRKKSARYAQWKFISGVFLFFRPGIVLRNKFTMRRYKNFMLANYFKVAIRQMGKNKAFTFINISGLSLAIAASFLILQYAVNEASYDNFHVNKGRIFRLQEDRYKDGAIMNQWAATVGSAGPAIKNNLPEVEEMVQVYSYKYGDLPLVISRDSLFFRENRTYFASERFFKIFSIDLLQGRDSLVLKRPFTVVLSRSSATKYFGASNPIGKTITVDKQVEFEVTGVFEDFPENSHFHPDFLFSFATFLQYIDNNLTWHNGGYHTYVLLKEGTNPDVFRSKLPDLISRECGAELKEWNEAIVFNLQRIDNIHLDSNFIWEYEENGSRKTTYFLMAIGVLILVIALINYVNLSLAKSLQRAREVGVRKVIGGLRWQLIFQFLFESAVMNALAVGLAFLIVISGRSFFQESLGLTLPEDIFSTYVFWVIFGAISIVCLFFAGLYPAVILSGRHTLTALKGTVSGSMKHAGLMRSLGIVQFSAAIALMIITYAVYQQMRFVTHQNTGFTKEQILVLRSPNIYDSTFEINLPAFKNELLSQADVKFVTSTSDIPGQLPSNRAGGVRNIAGSRFDGFDCISPLIDYGFVEMMKIKIIAGRSFSEAMGDGYEQVMINKETLKQLKINNADDALGEKITFWRDTFEIIGVMENYHHESLRKAVQPVVFRFGPMYRGYISVSSGAAGPDQLIRRAEEAWNRYFPGFPFEYFFLDDNFNRQYKGDRQFAKVVTVFSMLAIFIGCLGLFGLSLLTTVYRTKEVGIRKVLGASVADIVLLLNKDFMIMVCIAVIIALPMGWWFAEQWLNGFVRRIDISVWALLIPALLAFAVAFSATGFKSMQVACANPVNSLKSQ
jgi:putative ABC transport system permease protein